MAMPVEQSYKSVQSRPMAAEIGSAKSELSAANDPPNGSLFQQIVSLPLDVVISMLRATHAELQRKRPRQLR
jgi:hypothetical protein